MKVLIIFAHPDDESFGPGATIATLAARGAHLSLITFTRGERSTLGVEQAGGPETLADIREVELQRAARELGVSDQRQFRYPDGGLRETPRQELVEIAARALAEIEPDLVITFGTGGISGHPDHITASEVAVQAVGQHTARSGVQLPVYGWAMPARIAKAVAERMGREYAVSPEERIVEVAVGDEALAAQWQAVQQHKSQHQPTPWGFQVRLEVQAGHEYLQRLLPEGTLHNEPLLEFLGLA